MLKFNNSFVIYLLHNLNFPFGWKAQQFARFVVLDRESGE